MLEKKSRNCNCKASIISTQADMECIFISNKFCSMAWLLWPWMLSVQSYFPSLIAMWCSHSICIIWSLQKLLVFINLYKIGPTSKLGCCFPFTHILSNCTTKKTCILALTFPSIIAGEQEWESLNHLHIPGGKG